MKCPKHWTNYGVTHSINLKKLNINPKQKESKHFDIFATKKEKNTYTIHKTIMGDLHVPKIIDENSDITICNNNQNF